MRTILISSFEATRVLAVASWLAMAACSASGGGIAPGTSSNGAGQGAAEGGADSGSSGTSAVGGNDLAIDIGQAGYTPTGVVDSVWPPEQCTANIVSASVGAYCLGPEVNEADQQQVADDNADSEAGCGTTIWGVVRDFISFPGNLTDEQAALVTYASPDFGGIYCCNVLQGMVFPDLGADQKPVYTGLGATSDPQLMTSQQDFDKWYNDVEDFNIPYYVAFHLVDNGSGIFAFSAATNDSQYFPLDNAGWGNDSNAQHNFSFTTEIHTRFYYHGGEVFSFTGDDDLWVFINGKLAIDIGGVHVASTDTVQLDEQASALGITVGNVYTMDLFNAERHPSDSNFQIETSMNFVNCGTVPPIILK